MNSAMSNGPSLRYQKFTQSGCKDVGFRIFEFVANTQFLGWILIAFGKFEKSVR